MFSRSHQKFPKVPIGTLGHLKVNEDEDEILQMFARRCTIGSKSDVKQIENLVVCGKLMEDDSKGVR